MPKVKIFTASQNKKRDEIARALKRRGISESRSYAIATANIKKRRRRRKK